ncbi:MAG TPA: hypothetical protein VNK95_12655 [Caldilineaceae bacterium]|nr:hypothetical protein [Caldilineaceae bacterium]
MTLAWLGSQLSPLAPGFWLLVSVLLTALLYSVRDAIPLRWRQPVWLAHWLLLPYFGLLLGALSPRLIGLAAIDWPASLGLGLGLLVGVAALLVLVRAVIDLGHPALNQQRPSSGEGAGPGDRSPEAPSGGWQVIGDAFLWSGATEFHWAFLRGALWEIYQSPLLSLELPGYWAIWSAALIAAVEVSAARLGFIQWLLQVVTLITTSILFFYTQNFWLCWALHMTVQSLGSPSTHLPRRWSSLFSDRGVE